MNDPRIAFVLVSAVASGTERRMAFVYRHLVRRFPGRYRLLLAPDLFHALNRGGYRLDQLPGVQLLPGRHRLDRKRSADAGLLTNLGRMLTLAGVRSRMRELAQGGEVDAYNVYLELVPFLALFPLSEVPLISSMVTHIPKYFDRRRLACQLQLRATWRSVKIDCVYGYIADQLRKAGAEPGKLNYPYRNTVNHEDFHPEPKDLSVSFTARAMRFKNPHVMLGIVDRLLRAHPTLQIHLHGSGPMMRQLAADAEARGWSGQVATGYLADPSTAVNRSLVHVALEEYDNATNQTLLEGMASGCAIVASDVGLTREVVRPEFGRLTPLDPDEVSEAILGLLDRPKEAEAMGKEARRRILRDHHVDRYMDYLEKVHDLNDPRPVVAGIRAGDPNRSAGSPPGVGPA